MSGGSLHSDLNVANNQKLKIQNNCRNSYPHAPMGHFRVIFRVPHRRLYIPHWRKRPARGQTVWISVPASQLGVTSLPQVFAVVAVFLKRWVTLPTS